MKATRGTVFIGTSNIVLPVTKKDFPEAFRAATRLTYYASLFNSLEVNSTFYKLPRPGTFEKWGNEVPNDFRFTVKLWREITHRKKLIYSPDHIRTFMHAAHHTGNRKGCLLIQFPASITADYARPVEDILEQVASLNKTPQWQISVEFRDTSWYNDDTTTMLLHAGASLTGHDMPKSGIIPPDLFNTLYLRLHGPAGDYRGGYTREALQAYAQTIRQRTQRGKDVYVYFNNTLGDAFYNARDLQTMLSSQHSRKSTPTQTRLH